MRDFAAILLAWYERNARDLPWRLGPARIAAGLRPDPYRVWLSEIMLQQTTVAAVREYFHAFTRRWPRVQDLAAAPDADVMAAWAGLGYYARARNMLACARQVVAMGGEFPDTEAGLRALPGIGPYTAAAITAIAHGRPAVVMDGNIERVMARLHAHAQPLPAAKPHLYALAAKLTPQTRPGCHAQALMDLGATICTPRKPACPLCPVAHLCAARAQGSAELLPARSPRAAKPVRQGIAYLVQRADGHVLLETRPPRGLLGGMLALPTTDWTISPPPPAPPVPGLGWQVLPEQVRHTFTHFHLILSVHWAMTPADTQPDRGQFRPPPHPDDLPSLMRKAWHLARPEPHT